MRHVEPNTIPFRVQVPIAAEQASRTAIQLEQFDPYRRWLGIPEGSRPPTHYQLLGISPDEQDRDVIDGAVIRQSAYVRNFQAGKYAEQAARILNEIAAAKACLQDPAKRARYDAELKRKLDAASPAMQTALPGAHPARSTAPPVQAPPLVDLARLAPAAAKGPLPPSRPISRLPRRRPRTLRRPRRHGPHAWQIAAAVGGVLVFLALVVLAIRGGDSQRPGGNGTAVPNHERR